MNVSIGCAGIPALVDLRGTADHHGRELEARLVAALADEVAAASGLAMGKAPRVPAALVRGVAFDAATVPISQLVRPPKEDLFRSSPLLSISERRTIRAFGAGDVPREAVEEAVRAACTAPAPHHTRPWSFSAIWSPAAKRHLLGAIAEAWRGDLRADGTPEGTIERRIARERRGARRGAGAGRPVGAVRGRPSVRRRRTRSREAGDVPAVGWRRVQNLLLALSAQGFASCWISSTLFCQEESRAALGMSEDWFALGTVAAGPMPSGGRTAAAPADLSEHLRTECIGSHLPA